MDFDLEPSTPPEPLEYELSEAPTPAALDFALPAIGGLPMTREALLTLLGHLSPEERAALGIPDPVAAPVLERDEVLTLLGLLSEEERAALGITGGGNALPRLSDLPGFNYNTSFDISHSARVVPSYVGIRYDGPDTLIDRLGFSVDGSAVQPGDEVVALAVSYDFEGSLTAQEAGRVALQAGDSYITVPTPDVTLRNGAYLLVGLVGTGDAAALFYSSDAYANAPAGQGFVTYAGEGAESFDRQLFEESGEAYVRLFGFERDVRMKEVVGPLASTDLYLEAMINAVNRAIAEEPGNFEYFKMLLAADTTDVAGGGF